MTMHSELYCDNLKALDPIKAIRAIHEAHLQISAVNRVFDNVDLNHVLASLYSCLQDVEHVGYKARCD